MKFCEECGRPLRKLLIDPEYPGTATWITIPGPFCDKCYWKDWVWHDLSIST